MKSLLEKSSTRYITMNLNASMREAHISDLTAIVDILNAIITEGGFTADTNTYSFDEKRDWFTRTSASPLFIQVLVIDDAIVGYVYLSPWRNGRGALGQVAEISYFLSNEHRGVGYGRMLLTQGIESARLNGYKSLLAILLDTNTRSITMLKSEGFLIAGHLPDVANLKHGTAGQYIMLHKIES